VGDFLLALETDRTAVKRWPKDKITLRNRARVTSRAGVGRTKVWRMAPTGQPPLDDVRRLHGAWRPVLFLVSNVPLMAGHFSAGSGDAPAAPLVRWLV
jgi:hypothetical protein